MPTIYNIEQVTQEPFRHPAKASWTAIIPAAGLGTRLESSRPKLLYPVLGKPLFEWCVELLQDYCHHFIFVLAPEVDPLIRPRLEELIPGQFKLICQEKPRGMGQAIQLCEAVVRTPYCAVMWVDQIALSEQTLSACMALIRQHRDAKLILPTVWREKPYIRFERDAQGRIRKVHQAREEEGPFEAGENDCGIFFFRSGALFRGLSEAGESSLRGQKTGEINLLPVIPFLDKYPEDVITLRIEQTHESIGLNTEGEARELEEILRNRSPSA